MAENQRVVIGAPGIESAGQVASANSTGNDTDQQRIGSGILRRGGTFRVEDKITGGFQNKGFPSL